MKHAWLVLHFLQAFSQREVELILSNQHQFNSQLFWSSYIGHKDKILQKIFTFFKHIVYTFVNSFQYVTSIFNRSYLFRDCLIILPFDPDSVYLRPED